MLPMESFFGINFEFDRELVKKSIENRLNKEGADYICVVDGNITARSNSDENYARIINGGLLCIADGSWTPIFLKLIHGIKRSSYSGSEIFEDFLNKKNLKMAFLGGSQEALKGLKSNLSNKYPDLIGYYMELPYCDISEFDYDGIGEELNREYCDIIWVGLGAPKQERFMSNLKSYLNHGIMIGVGAVFNFYGTTSVSRCPKWLRNIHMEFLYRLVMEPKRQLPKFKHYMRNLPEIIYKEVKRKKYGNK